MSSAVKPGIFRYQAAQRPRVLELPYNALGSRVMQLRTGLISLAFCGVALAADKSLPIERTSNETVEITASLLGKDQMQKELGSDLGGGIVVLRVTVRPLTEKPITVS